MTDHLPDVDMASDTELLIRIRALGPDGEKAAQWIETLKSAYDTAFQQALANGQAAREANDLLNSEWFNRVIYKTQLRAAQEKLAILRSKLEHAVGEWECPDVRSGVMEAIELIDGAAQPPEEGYDANGSPVSK